jgi:rRNA maturation endonuclease Nob1
MEVSIANYTNVCTNGHTTASVSPLATCPRCGAPMDPQKLRSI